MSLGANYIMKLPATARRQMWMGARTQKLAVGDGDLQLSSAPFRNWGGLLRHRDTTARPAPGKGAEMEYPRIQTEFQEEDRGRQAGGFPDGNICARNHGVRAQRCQRTNNEEHGCNRAAGRASLFARRRLDPTRHSLIDEIARSRDAPPPGFWTTHERRFRSTRHCSIVTVEEQRDLIPSEISNRRELNEVEQANIPRYLWPEHGGAGYPEESARKRNAPLPCHSPPPAPRLLTASARAARNRA